MELDSVILIASLVLLTGVAAVRISARAGLPSLLLYLGIGVALGEAGMGIQFEDSELTMVLSTVALAVILAEGGFTTRWEVIRPVVGVAGALATVGVAITVAVTAGIAYLVLDVSWRTALIMGAVVGSTDAAATFSIMRRLPVLSKVRATLEAESGFNDPPVIILVTVMASDAWHTATGWEIAGLVVFQVVMGVLAGLVVARVGQWVLARSALPSAGLYPLATMAILFVAFAAAGMLGGSGLMAIYVAGLWLGNAWLPHRQATGGFFEGLGWLAQIGLFVLLGLLASPSRLPEAAAPALLVGLVLTLVARPLTVALCTMWWRVPWRQQLFLSWAGLRGAVPIVLATIPMTEHLPSATMVFDVVFLLVAVLVLVQAPALPWLARRTGVLSEMSRVVEVESAPLEELGASLLQFTIPSRSRLAGVFADDLKLPRHAVLALVARGDQMMVPGRHTSFRSGDHLLLVTPDELRPAVEERLQAISEHGRLALWYSDRQTGRR